MRERQKKGILNEPGKGEDDQVISGHDDAIINNERAFIFYFTHPGITIEYKEEDDYSIKEVRCK